MTTDSIIHLRVPAAIKARWVRESRAAGMKLTDWIIQRVEARPMEKVTPVCIPQGGYYKNYKIVCKQGETPWHKSSTHTSTKSKT